MWLQGLGMPQRHFLKDLSPLVLKISLWNKHKMFNIVLSHSCLYYFSANIPFLMKNVIGNCFVTNIIYFPSPPAVYILFSIYSISSSWENGMGIIYFIFVFISVFVVLKMRPFQAAMVKWILLASGLLMYWVLLCTFSWLPFDTHVACMNS